MAVSIFDKIITQGVRSGQIPGRTQAAREWYRNTAAGKRVVSERVILQDRERASGKPKIGSMYLFQYDAKHKNALPYWDRMPLIFPFKFVKGGFYGLNLHYLPLKLRAKLMDGLYEYTTNTRYDESTRISLSYKLLSGASNLRYFKPCVKHYLINNVESKFIYIYPSEWDIALFLPLHRFEKQSAKTVWTESQKVIY